MTTAFQLAVDFVDEAAALDPLLATQFGIPGSDHEWGDSFGPSGVECSLELRDRYAVQVRPFVDSDDPQERLAARVMTSAFEESRAAYEASDHFRDLRHLGSPFHQIRLIFDVMRSDTPEERQSIARRLDTIREPLDDYRKRLAAGLDLDVVVARRQAESVLAQARRLSREPESIDEIVGRVEPTGEPSPILAAAAKRARAAYGEFADWMETHYLPEAVESDGVGREAYVRAADRLVGMFVDPDEAYRWGWDEFHRLNDEMRRVAESIRPGEGIEATKAHLESDAAESASGTGELIDFVEKILAGAVAELSGEHFEVPEPIKPLTVQLAPPGSPLGVYYRRPSEDFSRPGGVWYSIGEQQVFPLYQHVSTAYHEGFPGHHLQIATAMYRRDQISRFQRLLTFYPGFSEGWAMYSEVLMAELGYLEDPRRYFGMLAKQMYRAARVVVDIGLHLAKAVDASSPMAPGEPWSFETAVEFMRVYGFRTPAQAHDEVLRYLGWPGQAISYKLGEKEILRIRADARSRVGERFDLRRFHSTVLGNGTMRLDLLDEVVADRLAG